MKTRGQTDIDVFKRVKQFRRYLPPLIINDAKLAAHDTR